MNNQTVHQAKEECNVRLRRLTNEKADPDAEFNNQGSNMNNQIIHQTDADCNPYDCDISVTLVNDMGSCEFFHDAFDKEQISGFVADCLNMGWPIWSVPGGMIVFVAGGRS